ncbi:hypothetical protein Cgig2_017701 [Carnegiea gigantea]|uniref:Uncharacterized protein n=1 Tax=Carnegiea gigantea TaxID=171969 RepID=A0A9Q1GGC7_9CARY|nr:hypothetical protein Cgig2_017701 [Carnegiea gigantea]
MWDGLSPVAPPKRLSDLCPGFELAVDEEAPECYELAELPQVIFYATLLNGAEKLREPVNRKRAREWRWQMRARPQRRRPPLRIATSRRPQFLLYKYYIILSHRILESSSFQGSVAFPLIYNMRKMANYVRESFIWRWRSASCPPHPLTEDFHVLCPRFSLSEAEGAAADFKLSEIVQATFYAMLLNEAIELGVAHDFAAESMKSSLIGLRWSTFEVWMDCVDHALMGAQFIGRPMKWRSVVPDTARRRALRRPALRPLLVRRMAKTKFTPRLRSLDELLAEGTQALSQSNPEAEVASTSSSASSGTGLPGSSFGCSSRSSSSERASTSSSFSEALLGPGKSVLKRKGPTPAVIQIVAEGSEFPRAPTRSDSQNGPGSHFPDPKVVTKLKRSAVEKQYLLPAEYSFVIPKANAIVNELPAKCIAVYRATLNYGLRFPLHPVVMEILNNSGVQSRLYRSKGSQGDRELRVALLQHRPGFMRAIEKKSKVKHWKYDFLFLRRESGCGDVPNWNKGKPVRNPFREPTVDERRTARYFQFYLHEDDEPRPIPKFMVQAIKSVKGPERRRSKSSDREPLNWLPKLKFFANDFFLAAAGLLILKNYTKDQARARLTVFETGDATLQQVAVNAKRRREVERQRLVTQQAKRRQAPSLVPCRKKPVVSLSVQKRQRTED